MRNALAIVVLGATFVVAPLAVRAQDAQATPAEVAERVRARGGYADDVIVLAPEGEAMPDREGAGRGPRGATAVDPEREGGQGPGTAPSWWRDVLEWLNGALASLSGPVGVVFLALGIALIVLLVVFFAASLRFRPPRVEASVRHREGEEGAIDPLLVGTGESADALAAEGRYREAIHALFLDALGRVGGAEGRHRGRTARELVGAVRETRRGRTELVELLDLTERVWFGGRMASEEQYRDARELASAVPVRAGDDAALGEGDDEETA